MTKLLERAFRKASELPVREQNAMARMMLDELASEERWDKQFSDSPKKLAALAEEARMEFRRGKTVPLEDVI